MNTRWKGAVMVAMAAIFLVASGCSDGTGAGKCETSADCKEGQVCDPVSGKCRAPVECADLECAAHQLCQEAAAGADAECLLECEEGWVWNPASEACQATGSTCAAGAPGSILQECTDLGRECVEDTPGEAVCGACIVTSQVLDPDTGVCRDPKTCDDINCGSGEYCLESPGEDAFCSTECVGPDGTPGIVDPDGDCVMCDKCDDATAGENGPYLDGLTGGGDCICDTLEGYFWSEGVPTGVQPCDRDGDGWVRLAALSAIRHTDPVIQGRAKCTVLRTIDRFVLHNEAGQTKSVNLTGPLDLYEGDRNDDQDLIHSAISAGDPDIPNFPDGREPKAEELNSLTKACVSFLADFNDNRVHDVSEWQEMTDLDNTDEALRGFVKYAYFMELHRGWYEKPDGAQYGVYHIREKSRMATAADGDRVPIDYAGDNEYWRTCARKRDAEHENRSQNYQGMDFAWTWENTDAWWGMNHHSQFKCLHITWQNLSDPWPNQLTPLDASEQYQVNACTFAGTVGPDPAWNPVNPSDPVVGCTPEAEIPDEAVRWGAVDSDFFLNYSYNSEDPLTDNYVRGCVNECAEVVATCAACPKTREGCAGASTPGVACNLLAGGGFGDRYCGCGLNFGGANCEQLCEGKDPNEITDFSMEFTRLFLDPGFENAPTRQGFWMCAGPVQTAYQDTGSPQMEGGGYKLFGRIPNELRTTGQVLCADPPNCTSGGYQIR